MKLLALLILSLSATAQVRTWNNPACAGGDCEVRSMQIKVTVDGALAKMVAEMRTSEPEQLRGYAFVQYIRGCVFDATARGPQQLRVRDYQGQAGFPFKHAEWQVDSVTRDPIYFSTRNPGFDELRGFEIPRNANYLATDPATTDETRWGGRLSNIVDNRLFVFDTPTGGTAYRNSRGQMVATNASLEFRICLHKIEDIPRQLDDPRTPVPHPIACLDWDARFHYNFSTNRYVRASSLHPYCR